jgi:hypothetical protein
MSRARYHTDDAHQGLPRAILAHTCILSDLPTSVSEHLTMHNFSDIQDDWASLSTGEDFWTKAEERGTSSQVGIRKVCS